MATGSASEAFRRAYDTEGSPETVASEAHTLVTPEESSAQLGVGRIRNLLVLMCLLLFLLFALIACGRSNLALPPDHDEANTHMVSALDYKNQFVQWMNGVSEQEQPTTEEWLGALRLLKRAIAEATLVSQDFLALAHVDLPELWEGFFIPSMEKTYKYYSNAVSDPDSVELPSPDEGMRQVNTLVDARTLDYLWGEWYKVNRDSIRAGIRKMAE